MSVVQNSFEAARNSSSSSECCNLRRIHANRIYLARASADVPRLPWEDEHPPMRPIVPRQSSSNASLLQGLLWPVYHYWPKDSHPPIGNDTFIPVLTKQWPWAAGGQWLPESRSRQARRAIHRPDYFSHRFYGYAKVPRGRAERGEEEKHLVAFFFRNRGSQVTRPRIDL